MREPRSSDIGQISVNDVRALRPASVRLYIYRVAQKVSHYQIIKNITLQGYQYHKQFSTSKHLWKCNMDQLLKEGITVCQ